MNFTYDYDAWCEALARRDGRRCYVETLIRRGDTEVDRAHARGVLACDGTLDGHHLVPKQRIKRRLETIFADTEHAYCFSRLSYPNPFQIVEEDAPEFAYYVRPSAILGDPRIGILACRRHHDLIERALLRLYREALPDGCEDAAAELGLTWSIERDYPLRAAA